MTMSDCDLPDQVTKPTKKYSNDARVIRFVLTVSGVYSLYRRFHPESQGSSRHIECHHESGNVCFPDVVIAYTIVLSLPVTVTSSAERSYVLR